MLKEKLCELEIGGTISTKKVRNYIKEGLSENEELIATLDGGMSDFLAVTDKKIVILKKGIASWATGGMGLKTKSYRMNQITGIHVNKRLMTCDIEISAAGMNKKQSGGIFSSAESENIVQFTKGLYKEVMPLVNKINNLIDNSNNTTSSENIIGEPIEKLEKIAKLKEKGIITEDEFEEKKKDLMKKI